MLAAQSGAYGLAEQAVITLGAVVIAGLPFWFAQRRANQKREQSLTALHAKADKTYDHINNIEDAEEAASAAGMTLGRLVRLLDQRVADGFKRSDATLERLVNQISEQGKVLAAHSARLDAHSAALEAYKMTLDAHTTAISALAPGARPAGGQPVPAQAPQRRQ